MWYKYVGGQQRESLHEKYRLFSTVSVIASAHRPATLKEAISLLQEHKDARIVAGNTEVWRVKMRDWPLRE